MELSDLLGSMPFSVTVGIEFEAAGPDEVRGRLAWSDERCTVAGAMHGGAIMTLHDSVGGVCAFLNLPEGAGTSTIESKTNLLGAVRTGAVHAVARPVHVGRTTIVVQTEGRDDSGRLVALTTQTQAVLPAR